MLDRVGFESRVFAVALEISESKETNLEKLARQEQESLQQPQSIQREGYHLAETWCF